MELRGRIIASPVYYVKVANCCIHFQCQKETIIGAPVSPHKARVPVSLNITSFFALLQETKGGLASSPQWFSGVAPSLVFESGSAQCFLNLPGQKG